MVILFFTKFIVSDTDGGQYVTVVVSQLQWVGFCLTVSIQQRAVNTHDSQADTGS